MRAVALLGFGTGLLQLIVMAPLLLGGTQSA
jgi:hypothetical protein